MTRDIAVTSIFGTAIYIFGTNKEFMISFVILCVLCNLSEFSFYTLIYTYYEYFQKDSLQY
jgi:MoaA/NifB/PqqE/SkfB family radical SAM enzyme